ncbi:hypothetical protein BRAS3809_3010022 [Bradyrhizobium sp. STM 3809]|nr:hypothetical protein BRAS3809_3010022 [Bradyrhizobium sp. STM 3809]
MSESAHDPLPTVWNPDDRIGDMLKGLRGLVVGVANESSIAFGCAAKLRAFGAEVALTYADARTRDFVAPLAEQIGASLLLPLNVEQPGELEAVFARIKQDWGRLDFVVHPSRSLPRPICTAASSTAPQTVLPAQCGSQCIRSWSSPAPQSP